MSDNADLPSLWTHEPHSELMFRPGDKVGDIQTNATPGFRGTKADAPTLQEERNIRFAELQEMLYANSRSGDTRSMLLVLQGMDTAGKGGIVKHVVGGANPQGVRYVSFASRPRRSWRTTICGASAGRYHPPGTSAFSTARTTRTC